MNANTSGRKLYVCIPFRMNSEIQYIKLRDGMLVAYLEEGRKNKPTILFIHGLANAALVWQWNIQFLKDHFHCIAIDLPGNGHSSRGNYPYSISFYAEVIEEVLDALHLNSVVLCGHSMGGQIAIHFTLNRPSRVQQLILMAPAGFEYYTPEEAILFRSAITLGNFLNMDELHIAQSIQASFFRPNTVTQTIIDELNRFIRQHNRESYRRMLDLSIASMLENQIFDQLNQLDCAVLVFFGEEDMLIPNRFLHPIPTRKIAENACAHIKQVQLHTYPMTGHFVHIEQALAVNATMLAHLKKMSATANS